MQTGYLTFWNVLGWTQTDQLAKSKSCVSHPKNGFSGTRKHLCVLHKTLSGRSTFTHVDVKHALVLSAHDQTEPMKPHSCYSSSSPHPSWFWPCWCSYAPRCPAFPHQPPPRLAVWNTAEWDGKYFIRKHSTQGRKSQDGPLILLCPSTFWLPSGENRLVVWKRRKRPGLGHRKLQVLD